MYVYEHVYIRICAYMYTYIYAYVCVWFAYIHRDNATCLVTYFGGRLAQCAHSLNARVRVYVCVFVFVCMFVCVCMCVCVIVCV